MPSCGPINAQVLLIHDKLISLQRLNAHHLWPLHPEHHEKGAHLLANGRPLEHLGQCQPHTVLEASTDKCCDFSVLDIASKVKNLCSANKDALDAELKIDHGNGLDLVEVEQVEDDYGTAERVSPLISQYVSYILAYLQPVRRQT